MTHLRPPVIADLTTVGLIDDLEQAADRLLAALGALVRVDHETASECAFVLMGEVVLVLHPVVSEPDVPPCGVCGGALGVGDRVVLVGAEMCHPDCSPPAGADDWYDDDD